MYISTDPSIVKPSERLSEEYGLEREAYLQGLSASQTQALEPQGSAERQPTGLESGETDTLTLSPAATLRAQRLAETDTGEDREAGVGSRSDDAISRDGIRNGYSNSLASAAEPAEDNPIADAQERIRQLQRQITEVQKELQQAQNRLAMASSKLDTSGGPGGMPAAPQPGGQTMEQAAIQEPGEAQQAAGQEAGHAQAADSSQAMQAQEEVRTAQQEIAEGTARLGELLQELAAVMKEAQGSAEKSLSSVEEGATGA